MHLRRNDADMNKILCHIDRITQNRDRLLLDISIIQALAELTASSRINLYSLRTTATGPLAALAVRSDDSGFAYWNDDDPQRQEFAVASDALLARCLARQSDSQELRRADGTRRYAFPLIDGDAVSGFVEFVLPRLLSRNERHLIHGFVALHRNFVALLEYSQVDTLTGLLNRKTFDDNLGRILAADLPPRDMVCDPDSPGLPQRRRDSGSQYHWLAVIDIDFFKRINDRFGHLYGDEVLILVAKLMKESFRHYDRLFRFGGEEFVVVLKSASAIEVHQSLERFRRKVANHAFPQVGQVTVSIGYTRIAAGDPAAVAIGHADEALYFAKEHGRDQVQAYEPLAATGQLTVTALNTEVELF